MSKLSETLPRGRQLGILVAVLLMYFFAPTFSSVVSTFSLIPDYYEIAPSAASWISSLACPTSCIAGLVIGSFAGRRLSYRSASIISLVFFTVFGSLPFFWKGIPFVWLLVSRALFGLGVGCINPLVQAIITRMFASEDARAGWIGAATIVFSLGATAGRIAAGALALDGTWQNAYAFYLLALVPLVLVLIFVRDEAIKGEAATLPDSAPAKGASANDTAPVAERRRIPPLAWAFIIVFAFSTLIANTFFNYTGIAMAESGCDTLLIGTVLAAFTVAGIFVAAANTLLWGKLRTWNMPLAYVLLAAGYAFCLAGYHQGSTGLFFLAAVVLGIGCCLAGMVMPLTLSSLCTPASLTLAIGLQEVARNLGSFMNSPWLAAIGSAFGDTAAAQFTSIMLLAVVVAVVAFLVALRAEKMRKSGKRDS